MKGKVKLRCLTHQDCNCACFNLQKHPPKNYRVVLPSLQPRLYWKVGEWQGRGLKNDWAWRQHARPLAWLQSVPFVGSHATASASRRCPGFGPDFLPRLNSSVFLSKSRTSGFLIKAL